MAFNKNKVNKSVTIRDVAEEAGVSIALVSFVVNAQRDPTESISVARHNKLQS